MNKLLPCPFCGSPAEGVNRMASCTNRECRMSAHLLPSETWNTRHTPEGWQLVPVVATAMMQIESGYPADNFNDRYAALLLSAPKWGDE